jgi:hypothetical protein
LFLIYFLIEINGQYRISLQQKASSIIYRLIHKTHYNIILHQRLDLLMQNILPLYDTDQQSSKKSFYFHHLNNQLKSYIAELRILKSEIRIYQEISTNIKYSLKSCFLPGNDQKKCSITGEEQESNCDG